MANSYDERSSGDTHPDSTPPLLTGSGIVFRGFADTTWDRDGFALDLRNLFSTPSFPVGKKVTVTLTTSAAFSGLEMEWAIVARDTWDQSDPSGSDPYIDHGVITYFGGIFNLGANTAQPPPGFGPVSNQSKTINLPPILPHASSADDGILIIDIFSAGTFLSDFGPMNPLDYTITISVGGGGGGGTKNYTGVGTRPEKFDVHTSTVPVVIKAGDGNDFAWAGQRNDTAYGGASRDIVIGDNGNDILYGDTGPNSAGAPDQLLGGGDNDTCYGAAGNDYINGEWGNDKLFGGLPTTLSTGGLART